MSSSASETAQIAAGAIAAQQAIEAVVTGTREPEVGWLRFVEITAAHGRHSAAARAFITEAIKRAAR